MQLSGYTITIELARVGGQFVARYYARRDGAAAGPDSEDVLQNKEELAEWFARIARMVTM